MDGGPEPRVSTGIPSLDGALGELYWGDNVVWELDGAPSAEPFYRAILGLPGAFDVVGWVAFGPGPARLVSDFPQLARFGTPPYAERIAPAQLLRELRRRCDARRRTLLLFEGLDAMVDAWGAELARGFFARCCPMLLELRAVAYWSMDLRRTPEPVRRTVESVTQCVLSLERHSVRIAKAEGRDPSVTGSLLHWDGDGGRPVLAEAEVAERVGAALRAIRRPRGISQGQLASLAGVTPSAISQAERAERGLSLATLVRLSDRLGMTLDDLLAGDDPSAYRIGRRPGDPRGGPERASSLVGGRDADVLVDLVHLGARERGAPATRAAGRAIVAVSRGLVQIRVGDQTPAIRDGEVLLADGDAIRDWRNLGEREAVLFWIVVRRPGAADGAGLPGEAVRGGEGASAPA